MVLLCFVMLAVGILNFFLNPVPVVFDPILNCKGDFFFQRTVDVELNQENVNGSKF